MTSQLSRLLPLAMCCLTLCGCMSLGGTQSSPGDGTLYDHRSMSMIFSDSSLCSNVEDALDTDTKLKESSRFNTTCFQHVVLLTGQTPSLEERNRAYAIAADTPHVRRVINRITIATPISTKSSFNDSWITSRVRFNLLADTRIHSTQIKIHTEDSVVYLMGTPPEDQAKLAAQIASDTSGVERVVVLFTPLRTH